MSVVSGCQRPSRRGRHNRPRLPLRYYYQAQAFPDKKKWVVAQEALGAG